MFSPHTRFSAIATLAALAAATLSACDTAPTSPTLRPGNAVASVSTTGNGGPSGAHYNLNVIGVPKNKSANFSGGNGGRIFVDLSGTTRINLTEGDFSVLDANGTDGTAAFQLPAICQAVVAFTSATLCQN